MKLTRQQHREWLEHPVTEMFFNEIQQDYDILKEQWGLGAFKTDVIENAEAVGAASIFVQILSHDYMEEVDET